MISIKKSMYELERISANDFKESSKRPIIIVLENVRSAYNVGSIFRTADAFLIEAIYLIGYTACPPHKEISKTALGATETVKWQHFDTSTAAINNLKLLNYEVFAIEQAQPNISLEKYNWQHKPTAFIFGNEVNGVEQDTINCCNGCLEIPQWGTKHSFNITIAAGIVLWQCISWKL
ncbi:MAG: TrmH family RNA methyltransferase [Sediminibacterium sp.]|nr:TrmH family RNA methyltransferase [Sediminibacterium sp.]